MKTFKQLLQETTCESNNDDTEMSIRELRAALNAASEMIDMIENGASVERWGESKITLASDYLVSVCTFMKTKPYSDDMEVNEPVDEPESNPQYVGHEYSHLKPFYPYVYEQVDAKART